MTGKNILSRIDEKYYFKTRLISYPQKVAPKKCPKKHLKFIKS